jgi:hypothetical protein
MIRRLVVFLSLLTILLGFDHDDLIRFAFLQGVTRLTQFFFFFSIFRVNLVIYKPSKLY